ncbi:MAG: AraC family transcriptional regulator [Parvibaculum sp.]|uniref:AraC family transcriptional regulator n=1 Tax=Parvibaculum sp. TaxID=2024848 RepID=UPI00283E5A33|nr:AraC family transcriptional regulator [Parvibaculum sp.]MDR3498992.1 AraC family transcriptional regulator [Parvibaculum sp.]
MSSLRKPMMAEIRFDRRSNEAHVEQMRAAFGGLQVEAHTNGDFHLDMKVCALPELSFMTGRISGLTLRRSRRDMADGDGFTMWVVRDGGAFGESRNKEVSIGVGEAVMARQDEAGYCAPTTPMQGTSLRLSRQLLAPRLQDVDAAVLRRVPRDSEAMRHLLGYLDFAIGSNPETPELQSLVVSHIYDLAALALGSTRDAGEQARDGGLRAARLEAIKRDIESHLGDGDLRLGIVAARQGISPVYVRKLFESEGTNFTAFVLERRLLRAFGILSNPVMAHLSIGVIAYEVGFGDLSYFNRAFRKRFGASPSDIRQSCR